MRLLLALLVGCFEAHSPTSPPPAAPPPPPARVESTQERVCASACYDDSDCGPGLLCGLDEVWACSPEGFVPLLDCTGDSSCTGTLRCHHGPTGRCRHPANTKESCEASGCPPGLACRPVINHPGHGSCTSPCSDDTDCGGIFCEPLVR